MGRKLSDVAQRRDHGAASNIKVERITIELDSGPEGTIRVHARVQVHDVGEIRRKSGKKCFLGWECNEPNVIRKRINYTKKVLGSPRPGLFEWAEDVIRECLEVSCRLSAWLNVNGGTVQFAYNTRFT
jgi:hypothetical protein